jgi:PLP dependent protein
LRLCRSGAVMTSTIEEDVRANLEAVRQSIAAAAARAGRAAGSVTLIGVSKQQPEARILAALAAGLRVYGENRVQEAEARWPRLLETHDGIELHLIGPLQTNKAKDAVALFDAIQSVDRPRLAAALARAMDALGRRPGCWVQVNTGEEPQKAGVPPAEVDAFIAACRDEYALPLAGLMCIPPIDDEPAPHFAFLAEIAERNGLAGLSMGMSADYEAAVELGATHVRVGSAIFGARPPHEPPA